jgi:hypothetical protein
MSTFFAPEAIDWLARKSFCPTHRVVGHSSAGLSEEQKYINDRKRNIREICQGDHHRTNNLTNGAN